MRQRTAMLACLALLTTACGGPRAPLEIGSKEIPVDIVLGEQRAPAPPPPPGANPVPNGFPGFIQPPFPGLEPGAPGPPQGRAEPCPIANPLDAALLVAREEAPKPPPPARYRYRNHGTLTEGEGAPVAYPPEMTRTVGASRTIDADGNYEFEVAIALLGSVTTTTYRVLNVGATPDRGVYLTGIVGKDPVTGVDSFRPQTPLLLMPFPSPEYGTNLEDEVDNIRGESYRSSGTDPLTQTTMLLEARITEEGKTRVDACGEWVDAFDIEVTLGRITSPANQVEFTGHYAIAPQYGALVVEDDITMSGTNDLVVFESKNRSRINRVPVPPK